MKKQFLLNLVNDYVINESFKDNENIDIGNIDNFNDVKDNIEVLYLVRKKGSGIVDGLDNYLIIESDLEDNIVSEIYVRHPYKSKIIEVSYIDICEEMQVALDNRINIEKKLDEKGFGKVHVTSTVYYNDGEKLGEGTNSDFHLENGCVRKELCCKSGEGYELCVGCQPINHSEQTAIKNAKVLGNENKLSGAKAYLYGHYWSCTGCTIAMEGVGISKLYLSRQFTKDFLNILEF